MRSLTILCLTLGLIAPVHAQTYTHQPPPEEVLKVFNPLQVLELNLEMAPLDWDIIRKDTTNEIEKRALFWAAGEENTKLEVSVRRKSSRALPSDEDPIKVAYKVDINEYVRGQMWHGLTKVSLENGADTDPISEGLAWNLHERATGPGLYPDGYHPGLAAWVRLKINGEYIGLYINVEERDSQFLRNRGLPTEPTKSWLYEIDDLGAGAFELEVGELPHSPIWQALDYAPFTVGTRKDPAPTANDLQLETELPQLIDMAIMLTQGAVDAFSSNRDALFTHGKNFRHIDFNTGLVPEPKRLYLMWDLDAAITDVEANIYGQETRREVMQTEYQRVILNHPTFREQYNLIMTGLLKPDSDGQEGPLSETALHEFLDLVEPVVTEALATDPYAGFGSDTAVASHFAGLREWVTKRIANVQAQVEANKPSPREP